MYRQSFLEKQPGKLSHVVGVREYVERMSAIRAPFFRTLRVRSLFYYISLHARNLLIRISEIIIGTALYVENKQPELSVIHPRVLNLLERLRKQGIIYSWYRMPLVPGLPPIISYIMRINPIKMPSGRQFSFQGGAGSGVGATSDEALTRAAAELLERYSLAVWRPRSIIRASFEELRFFGAVNPKTFSFFSEKQLARDLFARNRISTHARIGWVRARSITDGRRCFVPAQLVYLPYGEEFKNEISFWHATTNGVAAGVSFEEAACRAICEVIERDAFLVFWLNKLAPPRIDIDSIGHSRAREIIEGIMRYGLELHLFDMTTDMAIPTIAAVVVDRQGEIAVSVNVATDFSAERCLYKVLGEATKIAHSPVDKNFLRATEDKYPLLQSIEERRVVWSTQKMVPLIEFFLKNKEKKSFSSMCSAFPAPALAGATALKKLTFLRNMLRDKGYNCYLVDVTSAVAESEGLRVVRAIVPQLMPLYFIEEKKYLGVKRLYAAPVDMGYRKESLAEDELNPVPHPFI